MLFTELLAQLLRPVYGQAVVCPVPWVKADDIVVAFHILPFLVFLIAEIGSHTGNGEIIAPAVEGRNAVILSRYQPPVFIKGGLHGKLGMLKCEVGCRCAIVGILELICLNVANSVTHFLQDFKLQGGKVGNGGSHFNGQRIVGRSVFVEGTGDLIKVAADFSVFGYQLSNSGQQFIIDRGNGNNGANGRPCNGLSDKLGLAHVIIL